MMELIGQEAIKERRISWTGDDVVLVTGGAKGITAECALAFAVKTGVKLAIVGSTVLIDKNEEIQNVCSATGTIELLTVTMPAIFRTR